MSRLQFVQEAPDHTNIEGVHFDWVDKWARVQTPTTVLLPRPIGGLSRDVLERFESAFSGVLCEMVLRLVAAEDADWLSDKVSNSSPPPTGMWIDGTEPFSPEQEKSHRSPRPRKLIDELLEWLDVTYDELSIMTGVGRSTLFNWQRGKVEARASSARQLLRVHSLISLLTKRFGVRGAKGFLHSENSKLWEALLRGDIATVEERVHARLFGQPVPPDSDERTIGYEAEVLPPVRRGTPVRRASRGSTRGRLSNSD
jgi:hypothetical protein